MYYTRSKIRVKQPFALLFHRHIRIQNHTNRHKHPGFFNCFGSVPLCSLFSIFFENLTKTEREKRALLRVQNRIHKKPIIKRNKKRILLKKVVDYLKSDTYMFAPLISLTSTHQFLESRIVSSSTSRVEMKDYMKGRNESCLREKVVNYLKSDYFFYAPLFAHRRFGEYYKRDTMEVSMEKSIRKDDESTVKASNVTADEECTQIRNLPERSISGLQKL
ncbi:uncharacterized protein LOC131175287 [Hevea brasiliensis]|uniref:uncharacterized protein LOC131175287 n=1 Tax=Hevea brasiliensis TaxID=3981 RepID=UPI0025DD4141|nr:uncharacterized protein LOC131175287 [Hevea brasiliensis]